MAVAYNRNMSLNPDQFYLFTATFERLVIADARTEADKFALRSLSASKKLEKLLKHINDITIDITNEVTNDKAN